jgi:hypothetical protein
MINLDYKYSPMYIDGALSGGSGGGLTPEQLAELKGYDLGPMGFSNLPDSSEIDWMIVPRDMTILSGGSGFAYAITPAASDATFQILKNATQIGEVLFEDGENVGILNIFENVSFVSEDRIYFVAPSSPDNMLENVQITLLATLV